MPINLVDKGAGTGAVGAFASTLADSGANFDGAVTAPNAYTGTIATNLADSVAALSGVFDVAPNRTGSIAVTLEDNTGRFRAPIVPGANPYDIFTIRHTSTTGTAGQSRTPPAWVTNGTFEWPTQPQGSLTPVTANTMSELQSFMNQTGLEITIPASFGTQGGSLQPTGSDLRVIMSNSAQINVSGDFDTIGANRIYWTGGNIIASSKLRIRGTDIIFDDIYGRSTAAEGGWHNGNRVAVLNSTIDQQGTTNNAWAIFTDPTSSTNNYILANCRIESDGQNNRLQNVNNLIIIDCVTNPDGRSANSMRLHKECDNVWLADTQVGKGGILTTADSGYAYSVSNFTVERFGNHTNLRAFFTDSDFNGGTIADSVCRSTNTLGLSGSPSAGNLTVLSGNRFEDENGNLNQVWNDVTYPSYWSNVGAQRP